MTMLTTQCMSSSKFPVLSCLPLVVTLLMLLHTSLCLADDSGGGKLFFLSEYSITCRQHKHPTDWRNCLSDCLLASWLFSFLSQSLLFVKLSYLLLHTHIVSYMTTVPWETVDESLNINRLRTKLLRTQPYQRAARPVKNHLTPTNVTFSLFIRRVVDVDVKTQMVTSYATLYMVGL